LFPPALLQNDDVILYDGVPLVNSIPEILQYFFLNPANFQYILPNAP